MVYPRKSGENWVAKMMDLPYHQYSDTRFTINEKGAHDIEEEGISKKNFGSKKVAKQQQMISSVQLCNLFSFKSLRTLVC